MNVLYSQYYYILRETKNPKYLDFYDLDDKDINEFDLALYQNQTIKYKNKWFFVTWKKRYCNSEKKRDALPERYIKYLYKKPVPLKKGRGK